MGSSPILRIKKIGEKKIVSFYSSKTEDVLSIPKKERKKIGLFPTEKELVDLVLSKLQIKKEDFVLEPSFGTGEFIIPLREKSDNVYGVELESSIYNDFGNCFNEDFLTWETNLKFDFIIGNPPFFETKKYKDIFQEVSYGRNNIYSFFIKKSIDLLKENGIMAFITPKTINTGKYFYKIRDYIISNTEIIDLYDIEDFDNVYQDLQVIVLQKKENTGKFISVKRDISIFSKEYKKINYLIENCETISSLGFEVKTGSVVWNQVKDLLSSKKKETTLIWSENIKDYSLVKSSRREFQFVSVAPTYEKGIVSNRIFGNKLNFAIVDFPFVAENHVNVIINKKNKISYEELLEKIRKSNMNDYINLFSNSTQISKAELEEMPIWEATKEAGLTK